MAIAVGLFERIFGKVEKKELKALRKMNLEDVDTWVEETSKKRQETLVSEMQPVIDEILQFKDLAREIIEEIRDYKPPREIKKRMFKPVLTAKPTYVKGMLDGLGVIRGIEADTYEALILFNTRITKALKTIQKTQLSQGHIMAIFFQKEVPRLGTALNRIIDLQNEIEEAIREAVEGGKQESNIKDAAAKLRESIEDKKRLRSETKKAREEQNLLELSLREHEDERKKLRESENYGKLADTEKELSRVQEKISAIESKGRTFLGPLSRILRKYSRAVADKGAKKAVEPYIKSPQKALFDRTEGAELVQILKEALEMSERGELTVDEKRKEKVRRAIENLDAIKKEHTALKKAKERLCNVIESSGARKKEDDAAATINRLQADIKRLRKEAKDAKFRARKKGEEIKTLRGQLETELSERGGTKTTVEI